MVEGEGQVDHILLVGPTQLVEGLALQDLQVTDLRSLGEACGQWAEIREGSELQVLPPFASAGFHTERGRGKAEAERRQAGLSWISREWQGGCGVAAWNLKP